MGNSFNNFLRFSATSAFVACTGVAAADETFSSLAVTPEECSAQVIQNYGTAEDYLACVMDEAASDSYFYGRRELPHEVYDELLRSCEGVRGLEEGADICREIYPQSFHYDQLIDVSVGISFETTEKCGSSPVEAPKGTTFDFLVCVIGERQVERYGSGELRLSPSVHDRVAYHCIDSRDGESDVIAKECYQQFPVMKTPSR